jgi:hypothetical protein
MTDPKAVDAVLAEFGMQRHFKAGPDAISEVYRGEGATFCDECGTAWPCDAFQLAAALVEARLKAEQTPILGQAWVSKVAQGAYPDEPSVLGAGVGPASDASTLVEWLREESENI